MKVITVFLTLTGLLCGVNGYCGSCDDQSGVKDPMCGYDGVRYQTFQNPCYLKMAICKYTEAGEKLTLAYRGECKTSASLTNVKPASQLGTSGATYLRDKCSSPCQSTGELLICGTDGITYQNKCDFAQAQCKYQANNKQLDVDYLGACRTTDVKPATQLGTGGSTSLISDKCNMNCDSTERYPICGTDRTTYQNKCFFYQAMCVKQASGERLDFAHEGACITDSSLTGAVLTSKACSVTRCDSSAQRVCGSDGNVYDSECGFLKAQCANPRLTRVRCATLTAALG
ncbi:agrin-like [Mercenaria mercenaria]|uniref:agrin-like n=1 Tax=Mercenaria mercenaria TaxID=6596 RepID=UPI00234F2119|nr:agrin-like [Mercenaria mercenaria]